MKQTEIADRLGRDPAWVNRALRGPGNWTLRTFGEMVEALDGEIEIVVHDLIKPSDVTSNYDAYSEYLSALGAANLYAQSNSVPQSITRPKTNDGVKIR